MLRKVSAPLPARLNCPFYYQPHELCCLMAAEVQAELEANEAWKEEISKGKMFGILIVRDSDDRLAMLKAYSGQIGGREDWQGWVPAVFDYLQEDGYFKKREAEISAINVEIRSLQTSPQYAMACARLEAVRKESQSRMDDYRLLMAEDKAKRAERRLNGEDEAVLIRESQFQKAELKRMKKAEAQRVTEYLDAVDVFERQIVEKQRLRKQWSDDLQRWLFSQFVMRNGNGESRNLLEIFAKTPQRVPPSGAGECCAPKLLQYAFVHGLTPVAMAEFWWGRSPVGEMRNHLDFYPACNGKCKPILDFMLQGVDVEENPLTQQDDVSRVEVVYEDDCLIVIDKPAGTLSVPGKGVRASALEILCRQKGVEELYCVHRLDMQTSGLLVFAKTEDVQRMMQAMFEQRKVRKRYVAVLEGCYEGPDEGVIDLPLSPDFMNRPRQRVDHDGGKTALTEYRITERCKDRTFVALYPKTGRTHQLRVHCAHPDGLGLPIVGDDLYGHHADRLMLHAERLEFDHPITARRIAIERKAPFASLRQLQVKK